MEGKERHDGLVGIEEGEMGWWKGGLCLCERQDKPTAQDLKGHRNMK